LNGATRTSCHLLFPFLEIAGFLGYQGLPAPANFGRASVVTVPSGRHFNLASRAIPAFPIANPLFDAFSKAGLLRLIVLANVVPRSAHIFSPFLHSYFPE
jgi:hypothetical protein